MFLKRNVLRSPEDGSSGAGATATDGQTADTAAAGAAQAAVSVDASASSKPAPGAAAASATPAGDVAKGGEGYWPADWRETVSKGDAKILQRVSRYASPQAAMDALIAAQNRISAGELKPVLGKNASAAEVAEWRKEHGIPDTPDKYDLGKDVKIEGMDPKLLGEVFKAAHESNQTPEQVKATMKAWSQISNAVTEQRTEKDIEVQKASEDALRAEWGGEFRRNINLIHGMLDGSASPELKTKLLGGRLADGTPIGSSPEALKFLVGLALIQNPTGIVVPGSEGNQAKGIDDRIAAIESMMRTDRKAYNDPKISGPDGEYQRLLEAREAMKPRK